MESFLHLQNGKKFASSKWKEICIFAFTKQLMDKVPRWMESFLHLQNGKFFASSLLQNNSWQLSAMCWCQWSLPPRTRCSGRSWTGSRTWGQCPTPAQCHPSLHWWPASCSGTRQGWPPHWCGLVTPSPSAPAPGPRYEPSYPRPCWPPTCRPGRWRAWRWPPCQRGTVRHTGRQWSSTFGQFCPNFRSEYNYNLDAMQHSPYYPRVHWNLLFSSDFSYCKNTWISTCKHWNDDCTLSATALIFTDGRWRRIIQFKHRQWWTFLWRHTNHWQPFWSKL